MKYSYILAVVLLGFISCTKNDVSSPAFSVTVENQNYRAGDTVKFHFTGNPDYITFYSGENGHQYKYRDRLTAQGTPQLQFTSYMQSGTQTNTLQVLVSTNFSGSYDSLGIATATWTDITNRATLSTGANNTPSGIINLSDIAAANQPVYLAFRYLGYRNTSVQRTWTIPSFTINNLLQDSTLIPVATMGDAGWLAVNMKGPVKWSITSAQLKISGSGANTEENEDWVVTRAINLRQVNPDMGQPLKNMTTRMDEFLYIYQGAGNYTASFVVSNTNKWDSKSDVKEVPVKINP